MEHLERYLSLRTRIGELNEAIQELQGQLSEEKLYLAKLEDEATKAEILKDKKTDRLTREVSERAGRIEELRIEIDEKERTLRVLEESLRQGGDLWCNAFEEVRAKYRPLLANAARAFFKKLREAEEYEKAIIRINEEAIRLGGQLGAGLYIIPGLQRICAGSDFVAGNLTPMYQFARDCKAANIDLD